jgi:hypothetical protein
MDILDKIDMITEQENVVNESGIRNITDLSKDYKTAEIYFHKDLDGVTSAIGMKSYLKKYNIKTVAAHPIQYGGEEYAVPKPRNKTLAVMVDFAHGKPVMKIHTDHHDNQVGVEKGTSTSFKHTPSNAAHISQTLSPNDLFPPSDVKVISTVDSADFARNNMSPDDVMRAVFKLDRAKVNREIMGYATNTLVLAYKNKPDFLSNLVMQAQPSLLSMYNVTKKLAKEAGYKPPEDVESGKYEYVKAQKEKGLGKGSVSDVKGLKNGQSVMIGNTIVQYGGGSMFKGYDRYTPFKNNPDAQFIVIAWPMGLIQISKNPFIGRDNPNHLGDLAKREVLGKFQSKMQSKMIDMDTAKRMWEMDIVKKKIENAMGFTWKDMIALYEKGLRGLGKEKSSYRDMQQDIMNKPYKFLSPRQKEILKKIQIPLWDLVLAGSGGHKDITNISGLNFWGKGYVDDLMKPMMVAAANAMKDKSLVER